MSDIRASSGDEEARIFRMTYLFGLICPARGVGAALALAYAVTDMTRLHLNEISRNATEGTRAVLLLDRAEWHTTGRLLPETLR